MKDDKKRKQMAFDISHEIHQQIRVLAALKNITMGRWIMRAIMKEINGQARNENKELEE